MRTLTDKPTRLRFHGCRVRGGEDAEDPGRGIGPELGSSKRHLILVTTV